MSDFLLTLMINYGSPAVGFVLMISAAGLPLPTSLVVIAAGAFGQQGVLEPWLAALWGLAGVVVGDGISYGLGRFAGTTIHRRYSGTKLWDSAVDIFSRRGGIAVFLTRFLLTALAFPVNLLAGGSRFPLLRFMGLVLAGEAIWIGGYGALGYWFGDQWETVSTFISDSSGLLAGLFVLGIGVYLAIRLIKSG